MARKHRRHRQRRAALLNWFSGSTARLRAHPFRAGLFGAVGAVLVWLTLIKSLPFALASASPDLALALNPNNPAALIVKAQQIRERLLAQRRAAPDRSESGVRQQVNTLEKLPEAVAGGDGDEPGGEGTGMRKQIRQLAMRAIATDPLNAEAFELLGFAANEPGQVRSLMLEAASRSRRQSNALIWLLNDSFYRKDYEAGLGYSDLLIRTHPDLTEFVMGYLLQAAEEADGMPHVVNALAKAPSWRKEFFAVLGRTAHQTEAPLRLMLALKARGVPPSPPELAPFLDALIRKDQADIAYNAWLQFQSDDPGLLMNGDFTKAPSGLPFDWRIASGLNAVADYVGASPSGGERWLHVSFGSGRVRFPELSQVVLLAPGRYRLEGKLRGTVVAKRGLRWQMRCTSGSHRVLAETDMLLGETQQWRIFTLEGDVPASGDCNGQVIRLFHDSRSPSEEFISGEVWFGDLRLERIASVATPG